MSLVADYGTDSDSEGTEDVVEPRSTVQFAGRESNQEQNNLKQISGGNQEQNNSISGENQGQNYLISGEEEQSSGDEDNIETESSTCASKEKLPNPLIDKLPSPSLENTKSYSSGTSGPGSVFANPFENAEMAKQSILEKHVKMTEAQLLIGKKAKVCKAFKQGRCRYGKHCQYSHDLDANLSARYKQDETVEDNAKTQAGADIADQSRLPKHLRLPPPPQQKGFMGTVNTLHTGPKHVVTHQQRVQYLQQQRYMQSADAGDEDDDKFNVGDKRKKRAGLSQTLVPPKRAMSHLNRQRESERPWTVQKK